MERNKNIIQDQSPFKLRGRKLKDGRTSLFLDRFHKGKHHYEFLRLYLLPETNENNRRINRRVFKKAYNIIRSKTERELNSTVLEQRKDLSETELTYFIDILVEEYRSKGKRGWRHFITSKGNLMKFRQNILIKDIDVHFCRSYSFWLRHQCKSQRGGCLSPMTAHVYFRKLHIILENAVRRNYLDHNPCNQLDRTEKIPEPERVKRFLTQEELDILEKTPYKYPLVKSAFLFACFSGLRISDVLKLQWSEISYQHNRFYLNIIMKKTLKPLNVPLTMKAIDFLPARIGDTNRVFAGLPGESQIQKHLKRFCEMAGIKGRTHFHISRHTFATLLLTSGSDIYTASKMMGHSDIRSTQVYAKIIDTKKFEAIHKLENLMAL